MGYATIAFAFWERYSTTSGDVIDPYLLRFEKDIVKMPTAQTFLRAAFGNDIDTISDKFKDVGETYFFLNKAEFDKEDIKKVILPYFAEGNQLKFSDYIGMALVSTTCQYDKDINEALENFCYTAVTTNLGNYISSILNNKDANNNYVFPDTFLSESERIFNYFKEGINKWGFIDRKLERRPEFERIQKIFGKHPTGEVITPNYTDTSYENKKGILADSISLQDYLIKSMGYVIGSQPDYQFEYNS